MKNLMFRLSYNITVKEGYGDGGQLFKKENKIIQKFRTRAKILNELDNQDYLIKIRTGSYSYKLFFKKLYHYSILKLYEILY